MGRLAAVGVWAVGCTIEWGLDGFLRIYGALYTISDMLTTFERVICRRAGEN